MLFYSLSIIAKEDIMAGNKDGVITKTIWHYSKTLTPDVMDFLRGIAVDYAKVRAYVYKRYSGIKSVNRLVPAYNILNEMRYCGLRSSLNLPTVYYELAVAEALTNIRVAWSNLKNKLRELIHNNGNLTDIDRQYVRTVIKINSVFAAVLNREQYDMPHSLVGLAVDVKRLNNLICRLVRRHISAPKNSSSAYFRVSPNGYKCKDGHLFIVSRVPRKRVALPLKDWAATGRQIQIQIRDDYVAIAVPLDVTVEDDQDSSRVVCAYIGYKDMCILSNGHIYGRNLNTIVTAETERLGIKNAERNKLRSVYEYSLAAGRSAKARNIKTNNLGKYKYDKQ